MIDDRTTHLDLALPHAGNKLIEDVPRLRATLASIDGFLHALQTGVADLSGSLGVDIATLVAGKVPAEQLPNTDSIAEGSANRYFTDARARAALQPATATTLGGIKAGSGLSIGLDGLLSIIGSGGGEGLPAFNELVLVPGVNGQTVFVPDDGYEPGTIELFLNGVLLIGNGDDYTASDGVNITLTAGVNTTDRLLLRRWTTADTLPFSTLSDKPTTRDGYGITDVPLILDTLLKSGNLAGLTDVPAARGNLGLGSAATRGAIGAGDLYSRGGIVGPLSQSGGVPTGAAMGYVSTGTLISTNDGNDHTGGTSVAFANGLAICWRFGSGGGPRAINTPAGGVYVSTAQTFTFPLVFASTPIVVPIAYASSGAPAWAANSIPTTTGASGIYLVSGSSTATAQPGYIAFGRWF